ncbi:hypothetical protein FDECE_7542 [Fusarium decemcellulare]|nr:hypothetical protein FDECE_7542 [Fusarium decemcellulare]
MSLLNDVVGLLARHYRVLALLGCLIYFAFNKFRRNIYGIPGPRLAGFTNWWRFWDALTRKQHETHINLHNKYKSTIVRVGPGIVSISDPDWIPKVYGLNSGFTKTRFYDMFVLPYHGQFTRSLFTTLDEKYHQVYKRPIASAYSMSTLVEFEPFVDNTTRVFMKRLDEFADSGAELDFGTWLQMYAFDVVGEVAFGEKLGFLESGTDIDGIMADIRLKLAYASIVGQMPWLDKFLAKNPLVVWLVGTHPIVRFTVEQMAKRLKEQGENKHGPRDFLDRSFEAQKKDPELVTDRVVRMWNIDNVFAGSDTTAISLRSIFYYIMRSRPAMAKLMAEVHESEERGDLGEFVSWKAANEMPYLEAVIKESFRMHPPVGQLLERHVPKGGIDLGNHFLPEGTIVGMNPWVAGRNKQVYGSDCNTFRPERWLEATPEQRRLMDRTSLTFGHGARTCIGKNISLLEIYKLVPQLLRNYEISFVDESQEWKVAGGWFTEQDNFHVQLKRRSVKE